MKGIILEIQTEIQTLKTQHNNQLKKLRDNLQAQIESYSKSKSKQLNYELELIEVKRIELLDKIAMYSKKKHKIDKQSQSNTNSVNEGIDNANSVTKDIGNTKENIKSKLYSTRLEYL